MFNHYFFILLSSHFRLLLVLKVEEGVLCVFEFLSIGFLFILFIRFLLNRYSGGVIFPVASRYCYCTQFYSISHAVVYVTLGWCN